MRLSLVHAATPLVALMLVACTGGRYCLKPQDYQQAETLPPIVPTGELVLPTSTAALAIPAAPASSVPFGRVDENDEPVCLDQPPRVKVHFVEAEEPAATP